MIRCPHCLKKLTSQHSLLPFCYTCDAVGPPLGPRDAISHVCKSPGCRGRRSIRAGMFLLHEGCSHHNPLWDPVQGKVTARDSLDFTWANRPLRVEHWLLDVLGRAAHHQPSRPEMWFPQILLRGMSDRRLATLVKLSGSVDVGKSTLATVAFNPATYAPAPGNGAEPAATGLVESVEDYVYVTPIADPGTNLEDFGLALYPSSLIERHRTAAQWVRGTKSQQPNLKVAFLHHAEDHATAAATGPTVAQRLRRSAHGLWALGKELGANLIEEEAPPENAARLDGTRIVALYDTPGEDNRRSNMQWLSKLDQSMHVIAYFVDASELYNFTPVRPPAEPTTPKDSLSTAVMRMRSAPPKSVRTCLVVTKLDLVRDAMDPAGRRVLGEIERGVRSFRDDERELLLSWLSVGAPHRATEQDLASLIEKRKQLPVFFVWTDGLDNQWADGVDHGDRFPVGRGVGRLVEWCLGDEAFIDRPEP